MFLRRHRKRQPDIPRSKRLNKKSKRRSHQIMEQQISLLRKRFRERRRKC